MHNSQDHDDTGAAIQVCEKFVLKPYRIALMGVSYFMLHFLIVLAFLMHSIHVPILYVTSQTLLHSWDGLGVSSQAV